MRIYVDIDDVLAETARGLLQVAAVRFGRWVRYEDLTDFDLRVPLGFDEATHHEFMRAVHEPDVLLAFEATPGANGVLSAWHAAGHEISLVTGRPPTCEAATRQWLERHRVPHASLTFVDKYGRYEGLHGVRSIGLDALALEPYEFAVEDSVPMVRFLDARGIPVAAFSRPWNATATLPVSASRASDWDAVAAAFASVTRGGKHPLEL